MIAIRLDRVALTYIAQPIFSDLSWEIHDDRCVGLVGPNGCGKSSLLRLIASELKSDRGFLTRASGITIGYLAQEPQLDPAQTIWAEAMTASHELSQLNMQLSALEARLAEPAVYGNEHALQATLTQQEKLLQAYTNLGGSAYTGRVRATLKQVGIGEALFDQPVGVLSGGQKKLLGLVKLLVVQPSVLLLDEPDNHLDLAGKALLEQLINNYPGAVVIVSHDRYLLDLVVDEMAELEDGKLSLYPGDYSEYAFEKQTRLQRQQQLFQVQAREIERLEQSAKRLLTWGRVYDNEKLVRRGRNILHRLERMERIDKPVLNRRRMNLTLAGWRGSNKVLDLRDLDKSFIDEAGQETIVLLGLNLLVWHGERVGLVGPNGAGKSVLFRLLRGVEQPTNGSIGIGPSVQLAYYAQEHETLDRQRSLVETIRHAVRFTESAAVSFLGKFLFTYEQCRGPVSALSGGERSRLQLALVMLAQANFLLLDEPTNNLDIASAEVLEDALESFEGTVLVISHDRYFLDRVVDRIVELRDGALVEYVGNYSDYQAAKVAEEKERARRAARTIKR